MPSAMSLDEPPARVPAWKRLGLKLRFGQEQQQTDPQAHPPQTTNETKRKRTLEKQEDANSKRIKISSKPKENIQSTTPTQSPLASDISVRKSVSFTPDTKTTDGESIKQLFNAWVAEQKAQ